jgi:hypothetical protein
MRRPASWAGRLPHLSNTPTTPSPQAGAKTSFRSHRPYPNRFSLPDIRDIPPPTPTPFTPLATQRIRTQSATAQLGTDVLEEIKTFITSKIGVDSVYYDLSEELVSLIEARQTSIQNQRYSTPLKISQLPHDVFYTPSPHPSHLAGSLGLQSGPAVSMGPPQMPMVGPGNIAATDMFSQSPLSSNGMAQVQTVSISPLQALTITLYGHPTSSITPFNSPYAASTSGGNLTLLPSSDPTFPSATGAPSVDGSTSQQPPAPSIDASTIVQNFCNTYAAQLDQYSLKTQSAMAKTIIDANSKTLRSNQSAFDELVRVSNLVSPHGQQALLQLERFSVNYGGNTRDSLQKLMTALLASLEVREFFWVEVNSTELSSFTRSPTSPVFRCCLTSSNSGKRKYFPGLCGKKKCNNCRNSTWTSLQNASECVVTGLLPKDSLWVCPAWYVFFRVPSSLITLYLPAS